MAGIIHNILYALVVIWGFSVAMVTGQTTVQVTFSLEEQLPKGTPIGNIAAESNIESQGKTFQFLDSAESIISLIELNSTTGELRTAKVIDREEECMFQRECDIEFDVMVLSGSQLEILISVDITIEDINDNTPDFKRQVFSVEILESKPVNSTIKIPAAEDLDQGASNSNVTYSLSEFSDNFQLKKEIVDGTLELYISLVKTLDREITEFYTVMVYAKDAGIPVRTGTLTVQITVLDENDNRPVFVEPFMNISVTEDIDVGRDIITLQAKDSDAGDNGRVIYELKSRQSQDIYDHFAIDNVTGILSVVQRLVYNPDDYQKQIFVIAKDMGEPSQSSQAEILLTIEDAGNNPPIVTLILGEAVREGVKEVAEDANIDDLVAQIKISDPDAGANGRVECRTHNTYFGVRPITGIEDFYMVFVQHLLDREIRDEHEVTVVCVDGGELETSVNFSVIVTDTNDSPPMFVYQLPDQFYYETSMKENNTEGAFVIQVNATDADLGENARISFHLNSEPMMSDELEVDAVSGIVRAKIAFDRETSAQKIFQIIAVDHGEDPFTSTATVVVTLEDINDMRPQFTREKYEFEVRENQLSGTNVNQVTAIDEDEGINQKVEFYLLDEYKVNGVNQVPFEVMNDGKILTNMELDREDISSYTFEVGVHDFGTPQWDNKVTVIVKIMDINDSPPYFIFPKASNNSVKALNIVSDTAIAQVVAADDDDGINKELMYFIESGNGENIFSLDSSNGKLFIVKYIHMTTDVLHILTLRIQDKGDPPFEARENLRVMLQYTNITAEPSPQDGQNSNVIIVVTVVCITLLLSVTIIVVICLIRRNDVGKCGGNGLKFPMGRNKQKPNHDRVQQLANDKVYPEEQKNKKEVSFSLEEGDSFSSNDFRLAKEKVATRPTSLSVPEMFDTTHKPPNSILRPSQPITKPLEPISDVTLIPNHQREDSHSETSAETHHSGDSRDSGNGGSEEEMNSPTTGLQKGVPKLELSQYNGSTYMLQPPRPQKPINTIDLQRPSVKYHTDSRGTQNHNSSRKWSSDYPDSDYMSSYNSSQHNYGQNNIGYSDPKVWLNTQPNNRNTLGYINQGYMSSPRVPYHSQCSYRDDDDESTTTSGSYVVNENEFLDDSQMSPVTDDFGFVRSHHNVVV